MVSTRTRTHMCTHMHVHVYLHTHTHMHTHMRTHAHMRTRLRSRQRGWFVETLGCSYLCFNASRYGALLLIDTEDDFAPAEQATPHDDAPHH